MLQFPVLMHHELKRNCSNDTCSRCLKHSAFSWFEFGNFQLVLGLSRMELPFPAAAHTVLCSALIAGTALVYTVHPWHCDVIPSPARLKIMFTHVTEPFISHLLKSVFWVP